VIESTTGLILRTRLLTDTSLIVHWLTPDLGRIATVAKGARRPKSPFAGKLDLFYRCDFSLSRSRSLDLHVLREVALRETLASLRQNLPALQQAAYAVAFLEQTTETDTPLPSIYECFANWLGRLAAAPAAAHLVFAFELKLLVELGLSPDLNRSSLSPGAKQILLRLAADDWPALDRLRLSDAQNAELRQFLHGYLIYHLGRLPRGRAEALGSH
jgi:DNA repair protein RecO (recombination protein O)